MGKNNLWAAVRLLREVKYLLSADRPAQSIELLIDKARKILEQELDA